MRLVLLLFILIFLLIPTEILAHSGRTDSYGGHNKTANGTYHCHSGECLDDAWQEAYEVFYPGGLEDGVIKNDQTDKITEFIHQKLDVDEAEYMIPYALEAYRIGYEETYVPSFWEKYNWYIAGLSLITIFSLYSLNKRKSLKR